MRAFVYVCRRLNRLRRLSPLRPAAFERWYRSLSVVDTISGLRKHIDTLREQELTRTLQRLSPSLSEREAAAVQELTMRLINKILHMPTRRLKDAAADGQGHVYAEALHYLFDLEIEEHETSRNRHSGQPAGDDSDALGSRATPAKLAGPGDSH